MGNALIGNGLGCNAGDNLNPSVAGAARTE
jgi:hypothetical protein